MIVALLCPLCRLRNLTLLPFARASAMISGCVANRLAWAMISSAVSRSARYDLAAMVGGGREYVARTLSNWQDRKLVSRRRSGCYCLENKALLELEVKYR